MRLFYFQNFQIWSENKNSLESQGIFILSLFIYGNREHGNLCFFDELHRYTFLQQIM